MLFIAITSASCVTPPELYFNFINLFTRSTFASEIRVQSFASGTEFPAVNLRLASALGRAPVLSIATLISRFGEISGRSYTETIAFSAAVNANCWFFGVSADRSALAYLASFWILPTLVASGIASALAWWLRHGSRSYRSTSPAFAVSDLFIKYMYRLLDDGCRPALGFTGIRFHLLFIIFDELNDDRVGNTFAVMRWMKTEFLRTHHLAVGFVLAPASFLIPPCVGLAQLLFITLDWWWGRADTAAQSSIELLI